MNEALRTALKELRLSGMAQSLEVRLQEAAGNGLTHTEFLELVLQDELLVRKERQIQRRVKAAMFRELKTLEDFDWQFNPTIKRKQIFDLASCRFIRECRDCLFLGPPGTGKSHLVQAIGYQAIKSSFTVRYRSIFDAVRDFLQDEAFAGSPCQLQGFQRAIHFRTHIQLHTTEQEPLWGLRQVLFVGEYLLNEGDTILTLWQLCQARD